MLILDLWGRVSFHAAVVFGLGKDFSFKSTLGYCDATVQCCLLAHSRDGGGSENLGVPIVLGGHNIPSVPRLE